MNELTAMPAYRLRRGLQPPRLHWAVLLLLLVFTNLLFGEIWLIVQAHWIKKATGRARAFKWSVVNLCMLPVLFVLFGAIPELAIGYLGMPRRYTEMATGRVSYFRLLSILHLHLLDALPKVGCLIAILMATATAFVLRTELRSEPIRLNPNGVMTFLFGPVYFQYLLEDLVPVETAHTIEPSA